MTKFNKAVWAVFLVTALSLVMYGCGGGGGSSAPAPTMPTEPTEPTEPMTHDVTLPSGVDAMEGMAEIAAGMSADIGDITFSCPAGGEACSVTVADDGTATSTGGAATAAESQASIDRKAMAAAAEDKAAAERIAGLIGPEPKLADADVRTASTGNQSIVTLSTPPADDNFSMPVFASATADDATELTTLEFMHTADPAMIDGWTGGTYTHTSEDGNTMHTVVKYNDKADDADEAYSTFFSEANAGSTSDPGPHRASVAVASAATATLDGDTVVTGVLNLQEDDIEGNHGLFTGTTFPGAPDSTTQHTGAQSITGAFRGVAGLFKCAATCTSTKDEDGNLSALGGDWTFVPTVVDGLDATDTAEDGDLSKIVKALEELMVPGVKQDADFMIFGYWEQSVTDDEGDTTETMLPFADGKRNYGPVTSVTGSAKYTGPATGLYMRKTITPQGGVNPDGPFSSGQFTADAILEANFGGGEVAANHQFSVTGTISNFMDGGMPIDADWMVNLNRRMIDQDSDPATPMQRQRNIGAAANAHGTGANDTFSGVTDGGMLDDASNEGNWSGQFHGAIYNADTSPMPVSASGTFDAHFTNGHVRGAFATNVQE